MQQVLISKCGMGGGGTDRCNRAGKEGALPAPGLTWSLARSRVVPEVRRRECGEARKQLH